jgi:hypothetical protein
MAEAENTQAGRLRRDDDAPKARVCLRCRTSFHSEWSGERICRNCKSSTSWRNGLPYTGTPHKRR